jgi:hypothetical protein
MNKAFRNSIPPIATTLGRFLVISGCIHIKSFYGAEGQFRIEGEKPKDTKTAIKWAYEMLNDIINYLIKKVMNSTSSPLPKQRDQAIHYSFICTKPHSKCTPLSMLNGCLKGVIKKLLRMDGKDYIVRY